MLSNLERNNEAFTFALRLRANQMKLRAELQARYDFIVCGSGTSGSVVARRLAERGDATVLLLEAGGSDDVPSVSQASQWLTNLGTERDWAFQAEPNVLLNNRVLPLSMGKVLGGGSSINGMIWSRGHKNDWDYFASEAGDDAWSYGSVLDIYRKIEDWRGVPDPLRRGHGGPVIVQPPADPNPIANSFLEASESLGIPRFDDQNGRMMEGDGGAAFVNYCINAGRRASVFRAYAYPYMDRPNLTVLTEALVTRVTLERGQATGVEIVLDGRAHRVGATREVVLSLGAFNTPKVLMQSGIGDEKELQASGIDVLQHLPGVGRNFQDHILVAGCYWKYDNPMELRNTGAEATLFWKSNNALDTPDLQALILESVTTSPETARYAPAVPAWGLAPGLVRPKSKGQLRLTGPNPLDPLIIDTQLLSDPADFKALMTCVEMCRDIARSAPLREFGSREVMPGALGRTELEDFIRDAIITFCHETGTAKMGRDDMSVVNAQLQVYGVKHLRIADGSIMPRITTGNTMAPCVVIGEIAAQSLTATHWSDSARTIGD